jgi:hypothetical protein
VCLLVGFVEWEVGVSDVETKKKETKERDDGQSFYTGVVWVSHRCGRTFLFWDISLISSPSLSVMEGETERGRDGEKERGERERLRAAYMCGA